MNLKELKKFIQLCREQGVDSIRYEGIELHLGAMPIKETKQANKRTATPDSQVFVPGGVTADTQIITDELTPEQLLMWSAAPGGNEHGQQEPS